MHLNNISEADTREFFRRIGIADIEALDDLVAFFGQECRLSHLEELRDLVLHGCFRNLADLREGFAFEVGYGNSTQRLGPGIVALLALREFKLVPAADAVSEHLGDRLYAPDRDRLLSFFGHEVPEWLFPAIVRLAQDAAEMPGLDAVQSLDWLQDTLAQMFVRWSFSTSQDLQCRTVARTIAMEHEHLATQDPGSWLIYVRHDDTDIPDDDFLFGAP